MLLHFVRISEDSSAMMVFRQNLIYGEILHERIWSAICVIQNSNMSVLSSGQYYHSISIHVYTVLSISAQGTSWP